MKKNIVILGSTGSLGKQTLDILEQYPQDFEVLGLVAHKNEALLNEQARKLNLSTDQIVLTSQTGEAGLLKLINSPAVDVVINNISGISGILPSIYSLEQGKILLTANKEAIVAEGEKIMKFAQQIIPLDSEHNAIFEILQRYPNKKVVNLILPCSGGPLWEMSGEQLENVDSKLAANHPKWKMGKKISFESATLINKGLEIVEAHYLFNMPFSNIKTLLHPECKMHGLVQFDDCTIAYFGEPDMTEHIENALLHLINKPKKRDIREVVLQDNFQTAQHPFLKGIDLVLNSFKSGNIKSFLQEEQQVLEKFAKDEIKFMEIFSLLKKYEE